MLHMSAPRACVVCDPLQRQRADGPNPKAKPFVATQTRDGPDGRIISLTENLLANTMPYRQLLFSGHAVVQTHEHVQCLQSSHVRSDNAHTHTTSARSKRCRDSPRQRPNRVGIQTSKFGGPRAPSSDTPPCAAHRASITPERRHAQRIAQASHPRLITHITRSWPGSK
jgi:hypothetical protein